MNNKRCHQLTDSSSDEDDCFEDVPAPETSYYNDVYNQTGSHRDLPGPAKRRKKSPSTSSVALNEDESDNLSPTSANYESDYGSQIGRRDQRSTSLLSEDSDRNESVQDEGAFGNRPIEFYSPFSERERTISRDYSNDEEVDSHSTPNTGMGYYSGPSERERTKSQDFSEREIESNDEDYLSSTSASCSDIDTKPSKAQLNEYKQSLPRSFYGSTDTEGVSVSKSYESNDEEADKFSAKLASFSNKHAHDSKRKVIEVPAYTPKNRFVKSDSCDTARSSSASDFSSFEGKRKSTDSEEEVNAGPPPKKSKSLAIRPSGAVSKMMEKMGYASGKGLGKHSQGLVEPVKLSTQRGRRGLGHILEGLEEEDVDWDFDQEKVEIVETVDWLEYAEDDILQLVPPKELSDKLKGEGRLEELEREKKNTLVGGMQKGKKKMTLDDEAHFCDPEIVKSVIEHKTVFDKLANEEMRRARDRSNPFELIRGCMFLNRAAMKMANMDRRFGYMFTKPVDQNGDPMVGNDELLYFADVCAGPGGFSEYVLWRKKWRAKGFGLTLKEMNDFKLDDFYAGPCESFEPHYGTDGDGNVYTPGNIESFRDLIFEQTNNQGVHFMMADGGFSVAGQENIQEILSKQLYLCQCLVALFVVRTNGHFVTKLFDLFTPFSVGIIYLMYRCFEKICIFKPNTSRPANSERYLVCKWKRSEAVIENIRKYLENINKLLCNLTARHEKALEEAKERNKSPSDIEQTDVNEIVLMERMKSDQNFYEYVLKSNNELANRQIVNLSKVVAFVKDRNLIEGRQKELKQKCLEYWEVPDKLRSAPKIPPPSSKVVFAPAFGNDAKMPVPTEISRKGDLEREALSKVFMSIYDWQCVTLQDHEKTTIFYGQGRKRVHKWDGSGWSELPKESMLELSPGSIIYGELVYEFIGEGKGLRKSCAFHIIDAYKLGDEIIGKKKYSERYELCKLFCKAMSRRECPVRMKTLHDLYEVSSLLEDGLVRKQLKNVSIHRLCYPIIPPFHHEVNSLLFLCSTASGWCKHWSKSQNAYYYYNWAKKISKYEREIGPDAFNSFASTMQQLKIWSWKNYPDVQPPRAVTEKFINFLIEKSVHTRQ